MFAIEYLWLGIIFIFGAIIGSFLNVVIYRLHTGKSINGRSHCLSCGETLTWYELFPIVSYLFLGAKCHTCASWIPARYVVVELFVASAYVFLWSVFADTPLLFAFYALITALLTVIAVYDMRHTIIPDELVVGVTLCALVYLGYTYIDAPQLSMVIWSGVGGVFGFIFFAAFWYVSKGRWMGLGDAKLALPLGLMVGFPAVYTMIVISFVVGAVVSVLLLGLQRYVMRGKIALLYFGSALTIKSEIPFAPFLIIGFLLTHLFHVDIFEITRALMPF